MQTHLIFDAASNTVVATIAGRVDSQQFRTFALQEIALLKEKKTNKLIIDIAGLSVMSLPDQHWLQQEWNSKAMQEGLRHLAFVVPKDVFGKVAMNKANQDEKLAAQISIGYFDRVEKAQEWIKRC
ncbi:STAS/SEC14 domain-containing protein [Rhodocytophaga aerolata]|uniref:STAS/SEC14 domain-containing protein n=1 Tax=Rhodocytophaga aerolata TaxID=455078 RepID=A0ABT8RBH2_9BACT|nr:STAS/SEC14 domain-containing protein [Rhodocytophaga aerolata]MDO1449463.1 STAS/SEC14 domain-containing protein [Rhodocytophaga aerolata]